MVLGTFIAALFTIAKIWTQPKCPSMNEWIKKMYRYRYIQNRIVFSHKKKEIMPCAMIQMNPKDTMLKEISQTKKENFCMI